MGATDFLKTKKFQKLIKESREKFVNDLYFNPKKRESFKKTANETIEVLLENVGRPTPLNSSLKEIEARATAEHMTDSLLNLVKAADNVPNKLKEFELTNGKFKLFKKGKYLLAESRFNKGFSKRRKRAYFTFPSGLPRPKRRTKSQIIRRKFDLAGFKFIDEGTFTQNLLSFQKARLVFKGKKKKFTIEIVKRGEVVDDYWLVIK